MCGHPVVPGAARGLRPRGIALPAGAPLVQPPAALTPGTHPRHRDSRESTPEWKKHPLTPETDDSAESPRRYSPADTPGRRWPIGPECLRLGRRHRDRVRSEVCAPCANPGAREPRSAWREAKDSLDPCAYQVPGRTAVPVLWFHLIARGREFQAGVAWDSGPASGAAGTSRACRSLRRARGPAGFHLWPHAGAPVGFSGPARRATQGVPYFLAD
jgi:hypothetical protein